MKKVLIIVAILLVILFFPIPKGTLNDGGTRVYTALTYTLVQWNRIYIDEASPEAVTYQKTSVYMFPNNRKSIDELWQTERANRIQALEAETEATFPTLEMTDAIPPERRSLTLDDVLVLSQKGDTLSWSDFAPFIGRDIGSGLYIMAYEIDETFRVFVGGVPTVEPYYIRLKAKGDGDAFIDIRYDDVETFINEHT